MTQEEKKLRDAIDSILDGPMIEDKTVAAHFRQLLNATLAAERSRLLEEAGMPTDEEVEKTAASYKFITGCDDAEVVRYLHGAKDMRSRCSSLVMKEREKALGFAEWADQSGWDFSKEAGKWTCYAQGDSFHQQATTTQLYERFNKEGGGE